MTIRELTNNDIEECAKLFIQSYNQPPWNHKWDYGKAVSYLKEYIEGPRFIGFVLFEDDNMAGVMLGHSKTWWTNDLLYIDELFISPKAQRRGYGKLLLDHSEQYAKEQGCEVITLMTNKYMPAMNFYNNINYVQAEQFVLMFKTVT